MHNEGTAVQAVLSPERFATGYFKYLTCDCFFYKGRGLTIYYSKRIRRMCPDMMFCVVLISSNCSCHKQGGV
jgi:hypothetical protein